MSLNGVSSVYASYSASYKANTEVKAKKDEKASVNEGATYESTINEKTDRNSSGAGYDAEHRCLHPRYHRKPRLFFFRADSPCFHRYDPC